MVVNGQRNKRDDTPEGAMSRVYECRKSRAPDGLNRQKLILPVPLLLDEWMLFVSLAGR